MTVRFVGPHQLMGPIAVDDSATIVRGQFVRVVSGEVTAIADGANANLAVALDKYPDAEYEGTKAQVDVARLGEDCEIEAPFVTTDSAGIIATHVGGTALRINASGIVNLESTTNGVFTILRLGRETSFGDLTGYVQGVVSDAASI